MSTLDDTKPQANGDGPAQQVRRPARAVAPPIVISDGGRATEAGRDAPPPTPSGTSTAAPAPTGRKDEAKAEGTAGEGSTFADGVIDLAAICGESRRVDEEAEGDDDRVVRVERRDPAMLAQLAEALALIARGEEPFGSLALPAPGARAGEEGVAEAGARGGQRRRGERKAVAPTAAATGDAARQQVGDGADSEAASEATRWPTGPIVGYDQLSARELEGLIEKMLCDPEIMADPSYPGLSRQRLRNVARRSGLEAHRFGKFSPWIELWLARAGITARRLSTEGEWDSPRPMQLEEKDEIRRALLSTPWPTRRDIEEARAQGLGEGIL